MTNPSPQNQNPPSSTLALRLDNGYNHLIDLRPPKFSFCPKCYEDQVYHIEDEVCVMCGFSKTELDQI